MTKSTRLGVEGDTVEPSAKWYKDESHTDHDVATELEKHETHPEAAFEWGLQKTYPKPEHGGTQFNQPDLLEHIPTQFEAKKKAAWDQHRDLADDFDKRLLREKRHKLQMEWVQEAVKYDVAHRQNIEAFLDANRPQRVKDEGEIAAGMMLFDIALRQWTVGDVRDLVEAYIATDHPIAPYVRKTLQRFQLAPPKHWQHFSDVLTDLVNRLPEDTSARRWREAQREAYAARDAMRRRLRAWVKGPPEGGGRR